MKHFLFILLAIVISGLPVMGQVRMDIKPMSHGATLPDTLSPVVLKVENPERPASDQPLYAGFTFPADEEILHDGHWIESRGGWIWILPVSVKEAKALNIYFADVQLTAGETLFLYDPAGTDLLGAFTTENNGPFLATELISGNTIVVEYNTFSRKEELPFEISEIGVSVSGLTRNERDFGDSGPCEVLVNCAEGEDWKAQRDGVARVLVKDGASLFWCSGSMMNNTSLDGTPYFLTANHCGENSSANDYAQWLFYFNFESLNCEMPGSEPLHQTLTGASLLAHTTGSTNAGSDFKLLLLNEEVPATFNVFYNGWDWSGESSPSGVTIHHPEGDLKMISTYDEFLVSSNYLGTAPDPSGKYWKVFWTETENGFGVTEGGSSGSPLFSDEGYVLGNLSGGKASCSSTAQPDYYGKFSYSWQSNGTEAERQLEPWLDPVGSGQQKLRGIYLDSTNILADFDAGISHIKVGGIVNFRNLTEGEAVGYEWYFEGGEPESSEAYLPPYIQYDKAGDFDVRLIARSLKTADTLTRKDYIHVKPTITPNPSKGKFKISFGNQLPGELDIRVVDMTGREVHFFFEVSEYDNTVVVDLSTHASGIYLIEVVADGAREVLKAFLMRYTSD